MLSRHRSPRDLAPRHPLSMVYGGGGVFGIGYTAGVAAGLAAAGVPVASAPALGTSAGSWTAAAVALGLSYDDLASLEVPSLPTRRAGVLADIARSAFGDARHHLVSASAVCLRTAHRHVLDGGRHALADLVAASSAVPGLLPPHRVGGRLYLDGGMWSATSVDAAAHAAHVIVVAPLSGIVLGPLGRASGFLLERELRKWRVRHPDSETTLIRPTREMARLTGGHASGFFDKARAADLYPMAFEQGLHRGRLMLGPAAAAAA